MGRDVTKRLVYRRVLTVHEMKKLLAYKDKHLRVHTMYVDPLSRHVTLHMADGNRHYFPYHWIEQEDPRAEEDRQSIFHGRIKNVGLVIEFGAASIEVRKLLYRKYEP